MTRILILYDSSYLMKGYAGPLRGDASYVTGSWSRSFPQSKPGALLARLRALGPTSGAGGVDLIGVDDIKSMFQFELVVPAEVQKEIEVHLQRENNEENKKKRIRASTARNTLAFLKEHEAPPFVTVAEPELSGLVTPYASRAYLGADSIVDKLLLGYAKERAESSEYAAIVVATLDGGMKLELLDMRKRLETLEVMDAEAWPSRLVEFVRGELVTCHERRANAHAEAVENERGAAEERRQQALHEELRREQERREQAERDRAVMAVIEEQELRAARLKAACAIAIAIICVVASGLFGLYVAGCFMPLLVGAIFILLALGPNESETLSVGFGTCFAGLVASFFIVVLSSMSEGGRVTDAAWDHALGGVFGIIFGGMVVFAISHLIGKR